MRAADTPQKADKVYWVPGLLESVQLPLLLIHVLDPQDNRH